MIIRFAQAIFPPYGNITDFIMSQRDVERRTYGTTYFTKRL